MMAMVRLWLHCAVYYLTLKESSLKQNDQDLYISGSLSASMLRDGKEKFYIHNFFIPDRHLMTEAVRQMNCGKRSLSR